MTFSDFKKTCPTPDESIRQQAIDHQNQLTKPPGSLGRLEELAITLASLQKNIHPSVDNTLIAIFAGDHGVVEEGVSAFPQAVTVEMIRNFGNGGAAINVLANSINAPLEVHNLGTAFNASDITGSDRYPITHHNIAAGTANFAKQDALTQDQLESALNAGANIIENNKHLNLFLAGEMGIGNTTAASALLCAYQDKKPADVTGAGTGLDSAGIAHKTQVIEKVLARHNSDHPDAAPEAILQSLGGLEIAALAGAYIRAAQLGIPSLVDGFICGAAALAAMHINPSTKQWLLLSHCSTEPGYQHLIEHFAYPPLVDLQMRLGEGSGAATTFQLLKLACALHNNMATFASADVSEKSSD